MIIWCLTHYYKYGKEKEKEEIRTLGVYSSRKKALEELKKYKKIRGFLSHLDGFYIGKYEVDKSLAWLEGYKTGFFDVEIGFFEKDKTL